jgi:hypothetical protein
MTPLFIMIPVQIAALLLVAAALWAVGRMRRRDPRRSFAAYFIAAVAGRIVSILLWQLMALVRVPSQQLAYAALAVGMTAWLAAVAVVLSLALGLRGRRVLIYLGVYFLADLAVTLLLWWSAGYITQ